MSSVNAEGVGVFGKWMDGDGGSRSVCSEEVN